MILGMLLVALPSLSWSSMEEWEIESRARTHGFVSYVNAAAPFGSILLARKGEEYCAIRFTDFRRGHDSKPPTMFHSGDESLYAEYDWYYQSDGSGVFTKPNIKSGHKKLARKPLVGIGRMAIALGGATAVECGTFKLPWTYPVQISFYTGYRLGENGIELAPTRWRNIVDVKVRDSRVIWYRYDEKREDAYIPIDKLCCPPK
jgi:hypothetical protein